MFSLFDITRNKSKGNNGFEAELTSFNTFLSFSSTNFFFIELGHVKVVNFTSPNFHILIHQKILTSTQPLLQFLAIFHFIVHYLDQISYRLTSFPFVRSNFFWRFVGETRNSENFFHKWKILLIACISMEFFSWSRDKSNKIDCK